MAIAAYANCLPCCARIKKSLHSACCCSMRWHRSVCQPFGSAYARTILKVATFCFQTHLQPSRNRPYFPSRRLVSATGSVEMGLVCLIGMDYGPSATGDGFRLWTVGGIRIAEFRTRQRAVFYSAPIHGLERPSCDLHYRFMASPSSQKRPLCP